MSKKGRIVDLGSVRNLTRHQAVGNLPDGGLETPFNLMWERPDPPAPPPDPPPPPPPPDPGPTPPDDPEPA